MDICSACGAVEKGAHKAVRPELLPLHAASGQLCESHRLLEDLGGCCMSGLEGRLPLTLAAAAPARPGAQAEKGYRLSLPRAA